MAEDRIVTAIPRILLSESLYNTIRVSILNGTFSPGEHLRELKLAERFATSQGPVREALRPLEQEGLVRRIPHRGTFVAEITEKEITEIYELRAVLESLAIKWFVRRAKPDNIRALKQLVEAMKMAATKGELAELVEKDMLFHRYICEVPGSQALLAMWSIIEGKICLAIATMDRSYQQNLKEIADLHKPIVDAIAARDVARALQLNQDHMRFILGDILDNKQTWIEETRKEV